MSFSSHSSTAADAAAPSLLLKWVTLPSAASQPASAALPSAAGSLSGEQALVGQYFDQDFLGSAGEILGNFVESGQIWALLIGIVLGYLIRGLTTY